MNFIEFEIYVSASSFHTISIFVKVKQINCHSLLFFSSNFFTVYSQESTSIISPWEQDGGVFGETVITFKY